MNIAEAEQYTQVLRADLAKIPEAESAFRDRFWRGVLHEPSYQDARQSLLGSLGTRLHELVELKSVPAIELAQDIGSVKPIAEIPVPDSSADDKPETKTPAQLAAQAWAEELWNTFRQPIPASRGKDRETAITRRDRRLKNQLAVAV